MVVTRDFSTAHLQVVPVAKHRTSRQGKNTATQEEAVPNRVTRLGVTEATLQSPLAWASQAYFPIRNSLTQAMVRVWRSRPRLLPWQCHSTVVYNRRG